MKTRRKFLLVALLFLILVGGWLAWEGFNKFFPTAFERKQRDEEAVAKLAGADLTQQERTTQSTTWPQFLGPNRDGWASANKFEKDWGTQPPKTLWTAPCGGGYSSFAVVGGKVYTQDRDGDDERVLCLDANTGATLWKHNYPGNYPSGFEFPSGPRSTPSIDEGRIYSVGARGKMLCLAEPIAPSTTPTVLWEKDFAKDFRAPIPRWGVACSPLIEGDLVIVQPGGAGGSVVALDKRTGEKRWAAGEDASGYSSPVAGTLGGVRQVIAVTGNSVLGVRVSDGKQLWRFPWKTQFDGNVAAPVIVKDYVFLSSAYNKGCALLNVTATGEGQAEAKPVYVLPNELMRNHHSGCVHKDGFLYGFDNNELRCINMREQEVASGWSGEIHDQRKTKGSLVLVGDSLLVLTQNGTLFVAAADPKEFRLMGKLEKVLSGNECWAIPVVQDGLILVRDQKQIVCLDSRAKR